MSAHPHITALFVAPAAGEPMIRIQEVWAFACRGLEGDRYMVGTGYYSARDPCEVTCIDGDALDRITAEYGLNLNHGEHRRNVVTRGIKLRGLAGKRLRIGDVLLEYVRPRPPCNYIERLTQPGMTRALGADAGIALRILEPGSLRENAEIQILAIPGYRAPRVLP